jgi:hypothetical protein
MSRLTITLDDDLHRAIGCSLKTQARKAQSSPRQPGLNIFKNRSPLCASIAGRAPATGTADKA